MRTPYCLPVDVLRKFDPTMDRSDLEGDMLFDSGDREKFTAEIEDACGEFDAETNNAQRLTRVGRGDGWEYHDATFRKHQGGTKVYLDHRNVLPLDPAEGDRLELRTTRDSWKDITDSDGRYRLNAPDGVLQIFTRRVSIVGRHRRAMISDNIRVRYRYGAIGGTRDRPGQTSLESDVDSGDDSLPAENTDRLPRSATVMVGGENPEYVRYSNADPSTEELTGVTRAMRGTADAEHEAGDPVHYCRMNVRKAVAGRVAAEFVRSDDIADNLPTPDDNIGHADKIEAWNQDWMEALGKYSEAYLH